MSVNEDKVREAIKEIKTWGFAPLPVDMIVAKLEQSIAPPKPEIPEGCPVLAWNDGEDKQKTHLYNVGHADGEVYYRCGDEGSYEAYEHIKIDYQRKGHVIPWHGGECPVDDETVVLAYFRDGITRRIFNDKHKGWKHTGIETECDIMAYVIWPTYLTEGSND